MIAEWRRENATTASAILSKVQSLGGLEMKRCHVASTMILFILSVIINFSYADENAIKMRDSVWADREEKHIYSFLKNNEFRFVAEIQRPSQEGDQEYDPRGTVKMITETEKAEGVYRLLGDNYCWFETQLGTQKGNLMIYVDRIQCCMLMEFVGEKLVLSEVWMKPQFYFDHLGICENRVLTKLK
jgi:hypothetical protein